MTSQTHKRIQTSEDLFSKFATQKKKEKHIKIKMTNVYYAVVNI
jgi:hypothetical protein